MKIYKLPLLLLLLFAINLTSCNNIQDTKKHNSENNPTDNILKENTIYWNKKSVLENTKFDRFFFDYLNDSTNSKNEYFFLNIFGRYDTIMFVLSPIMGSRHQIMDSSPIGIMRKSGKLIFILDPLSDIVKHDTTEYVEKKLKEALKRIKKENIISNKIWMLKIPLYSDSSEVVKDSKLIEEQMYNIKYKKIDIFNSF